MPGRIAIASLIGATRICYGAHSYAIAISWSTACMHMMHAWSNPVQKKLILVFSKQYMDQSACQVHALVSTGINNTLSCGPPHASSAELTNMFIKACSPFQAHTAACLTCVDIHETRTLH